MEKLMFYIHSLNKGGAERVLLTIAKELKENYNVIVLTDCIDELEYNLPDGISRVNIADKLVELNKKNNFFNRLYLIRKECHANKPKCIIAFMLSSSLRCVLANLLNKRVVISTIRSDPYESFGTFGKRLFVNLVMGFSEAIVCQTDFQKNYLYKFNRKKSKVILNPISDEVKVEPFGGERSNRIVATGRLVDFKNYELMIETFAEIADDYPNINLEIFGDGPRKEILLNLINECGLNNRVILRGDSSNIPNDIRDALFYIMTTNSEGMPNSLMEAMSLGLPVISTDCIGGGASALIENGYNGLIVPRSNKKELVVACRKLLNDKKLREKLGTHAREIQDKCDIKRIVKEWEQLWKTQ